MRTAFALLLLLAVRPVVAQQVPIDAPESLIRHIYAAQERERLRAESSFGVEAVPRNIVIVITRETMQRHMDLDIDALSGLLTRLSARHIPARWCQLSCPIAAGDRRVYITQVLRDSTDDVILEVLITGKSLSGGAGGFTAWSRKHLIRMQRLQGSWEVVEDRISWVGDI